MRYSAIEAGKTYSRTTPTGRELRRRVVQLVYSGGHRYAFGPGATIVEYEAIYRGDHGSLARRRHQTLGTFARWADSAAGG